MLVECKTRKVHFQGQKVTVLIQNNDQQARDSQQLTFLYCSLFKTVLNLAC